MVDTLEPLAALEVMTASTTSASAPKTPNAGGEDNEITDGRSPTPITNDVASGRLGGRDLLRATPRVVWWLVGLQMALLLVWSVVMPLYHAPDEPNHVDAVIMAEHGSWPRPGTAHVSDQGIGAIVASPFGTGNRQLSLSTAPLAANQAPPRSARPPYRDLKALPGTHDKIAQQMTQHPPLYYGLDAAVLRALPGSGGWRWDVTVAVLRLLSALMVAPLPWLCWAAARTLLPEPRMAVLAAVLPIAVPELSHIGSTVNNDNLIILLAASLMIPLAQILRGDLSRRTAAIAGVVSGLALMTKGLAFPLVAALMAAYLVAIVDRRRAHRAPFSRRGSGPGSLVLALVVAFVVGGWWWGVNLLRYGTLQPAGAVFVRPGQLSQTTDLPLFVWTFLKSAVQRWWGAFGWFEVNLPYALVLVLALGLTLTCAVPFVRARVLPRRQLAVLLVPLVLLAGLIFVGSLGEYLRAHTFGGVSGRYFFPGVAGLSVVVAAAGGELPRRAQRALVPTALMAALLLQAGSLVQVFHHFWAPSGISWRGGLYALRLWSAWPTQVVYGFLFALLIAGIGSLAVALLAARQGMGAQLVSEGPTRCRCTADSQIVTGDAGGRAGSRRDR